MKTDIKNVAFLVRASARENAFETVREMGSMAGDQHDEFEGWYRSTAEMIIDQLGGECHPFTSHSSYGLTKALTPKQQAAVRKLVLS